MNVSWVKRHDGGCPLAAVVVSWLPTCAQVSSVLAPVASFFWGSILFAILFVGVDWGGFLFGSQTMEWWLSAGWEGAPPHFIAHTTFCRTGSKS